MVNNVFDGEKRIVCSGCGACFALCPSGAINVSMNAKGFFEAQIDETRCVGCGLCKSACPGLNAANTSKSLENGRIYALRSASGETVRTCTSGGVAYELSLYAIENGASVAGVIYDCGTDTARHVIARNESELEALKGSKYIMSDTHEAFREVLDALRKDGSAQFTVFGTPCQAAGLDAAARAFNVRDRLLLVELFCHGVPSYRLWENTVKRVKKRLGAKQFESVGFRYKKDDWHSYCLRIDANGKSYCGERERDMFWRMYFENMFMNEACLSCDMRKANSRADIRLGDYWGVRFSKYSDGVSLCIAVTEAGEKAVEGLISDGRVEELETGSAAEALSAQNMNGYGELEARINAEALEMLGRGDDVRKIFSHCMKRLPLKRRLKAALMAASGIMPARMRVKVKRMMRRNGEK